MNFKIGPYNSPSEQFLGLEKSFTIDDKISNENMSSKNKLAFTWEIAKHQIIARKCLCDFNFVIKRSIQLIRAVKKRAQQFVGYIWISETLHLRFFPSKKPTHFQYS